VVGLCWWMWPRVDQRFVGKWTIQGGQQALEFFWDGSGVEQAPNVSTDLKWQVKDDVLRLSHGPLVGFRKSPWTAIRRLIAGGTPSTPYRFEILDRDTILLRGGTGTTRGAFEMTLLRVTE
jgi:hypothetical protein